MNKVTLTVFTPTYNRMDKLKRAYESLKGQSAPREAFEWVITDDGSTDGTGEMVKSWIEEDVINIRYHYQENGGKMRAHNAGARLSRGELFVCLDSDDCFTKTAVDDILKKWEEDGNSSFCAGIIAHKGSSETEALYGAVFPRKGSSTLSGLYREGFKGETTLVFRTDVISRFPFPEIEGEKYVPEDYVYDLIDREYEYLILDKILTICELVEEGYSDRVEQLRSENPTAWYLYYVNRTIHEPMSVLKLKYAGHYLRFRPLARREYADRYHLGPLTALLGVPAAFALALKGKL